MNKAWRIVVFAIVISVLGSCVNGISAPETNECPTFSIADSLRSGGTLSDTTSWAITIKCQTGIR